MGEFVTPTGLNRKTLQELRVEFENKFKQVFGVTFETAVDSPNGLLVSQLALSYNDLWELAQDLLQPRPEPGRRRGSTHARPSTAFRVNRPCPAPSMPSSILAVTARRSRLAPSQSGNAAT